MHTYVGNLPIDRGGGWWGGHPNRFGRIYSHPPRPILLHRGVGARFGCLALSFKKLSVGGSAAKATALTGNTLAEDNTTDARTT